MSDLYDKAFVAASGQYLTEYVPDDYADMDDHDFNEFVSDHLWEGVENLPISEVISQIAQSAEVIIKFYEENK